MILSQALAIYQRVLIKSGTDQCIPSWTYIDVTGRIIQHYGGAVENGQIKGNDTVAAYGIGHGIQMCSGCCDHSSTWSGKCIASISGNCRKAGGSMP